MKRVKNLEEYIWKLKRLQAFKGEWKIWDVDIIHRGITLYKDRERKNVRISKMEEDYLNAIGMALYNENFKNIPIIEKIFSRVLVEETN